MEGKTIYVAHDIEKTGSFIIGNPVVSVGFYIGDESGNEVASKRFNLKVKWPTLKDGKITDYGDFEKRCWDEFWSKLDPKIRDECKIDAMDQKEGWIKIGEFINGLEEAKTKFLTDNASYDTATIDYNLEKYTGRAPMRYTLGGKYRSVISADDMFDMLPSDVAAKANARIDARVKHDHNPVHDAEYIYLLYVEARKMMPKKH